GHGTIVADLSARGNAGQLLNGPLWNATGWGAGSQGFGAILAGLSPGATYHFRAVAINSGGMARGTDQSFTTLPLPRVISVTPKSGSQCLLQFSGLASASYILEVSTNLAGWTALTNLSAGPDGLFQFLDIGATSFRSRFYRLRVR